MAGLYDEQILGARQQKEFARKLRENANNEPAGQMVSGWYVPNTGGAITGALKNIIGAYQENKADEELKGLQRDKDIATVQAFNKAGFEAPEALLQRAGTSTEAPNFLSRAASFLRGEEPQKPSFTPYQQNVAQNLTPEQREAGLMNAMMINPDMASGVSGLYTSQLDREAKKQLQAETLQARREESEASRQARREDAEAARQSREDIARMNIQARQDMAALAGAGRQMTPYQMQQMAISQGNYDMARQRFEREIAKENQGKDVPANQLAAQTENFALINKLDKAIEEADKNPEAFGAMNYLPSFVTQRLDEGGIGPRGSVAEISATKIHDLSGAAVSPTEAPRFAPFLPSAVDKPEKIKENLKQMREGVINMEEERNKMYSDGWKPQLQSIDRFRRDAAPEQALKTTPKGDIHSQADIIIKGGK